MRPGSTILLASWATVACVLAAACSPSRAPDGDVAAGALGAADAAAGATGGLPESVHLHVATPIAAHLGQAVRLDAVDGGARVPSFLDATCVAGEQASADGAEVSTVHGGVLADGRPGLATDAPPLPFVGDAATEFAAATTSSVTRVSGYREADLARVASVLHDEQRLSNGPECGTHFVRSTITSRFVDYALVVDFPSLASRHDFVARFGGMDALLARKAGAWTMLRERGATIRIEVLVSQGLAALVAAKLATTDCSAAHLEGCVAAHEALAEMAGQLGSLAAGDDVYRVEMTRNEVVP